MSDVTIPTAGLSRRAFIRMSTVAGLVGIPALLAACGGSAAPASSSAASPAPASAAPASAASSAAPASASAAASGSVAASPAASGAGSAAAKPAAGGTVKLPTYVPSTLVKADLPGGENGQIDPGFLSYPKDPPKSVPNTPANGGQVTVTTWQNANGGVVVPVDQNPMWQAVNKELGTNLKVNVVPFSDYVVKLPTIIAGGDLPDLLYLPPGGGNLAQLPQFLSSAMMDLTPYLSGDAIKDYPNLANIPTTAWRNVIYNNAIYGVVLPYPPTLWIHWAHQELLDQDNLQMPKSTDDYTSLLKHFTNPGKGLWGLGLENANPGTGFSLDVGFFSSMFGAPNQWSLDNGKLTRTYETDQFKAAISYAKDLWSAGYINPNSLTNDISKQRTDMQARKFVFDWDGFQQASQLFWQTKDNLNPPGKYRIVPPFSDGKSKPIYWANNGSFGFTVIKKTTPDRVKELLRVLNYIAAPFGSHEYLLMHYGVEGTDYKMDANNNPILTDKGKQDTGFPWVYISQPPGWIYYPGSSDYAQALQDGEKAIFPTLQQDPTVGYYSETFASKNAVLTQAISDSITAVVRGQEPLSSFNDAVAKYNSGGGDQMKAEYLKAMQAAS